MVAWAGAAPLSGLRVAVFAGGCGFAGAVPSGAVGLAFKVELFAAWFGGVVAGGG